VFQCLRRWIEEGQIPIPALAETPLFAYAFEALAYDELFDTAVSVICDIVHETQEIADNMAVIELIVPRLLALKPMIHTAGDDSDKMRGYSRIFTEAGETYRVLILEHPETFFPIVEAIAECTTYSDLDVVPITFAFWYRLAQSIGKKPSVSQPFFDIFKALVGIIIRHLHFPADLGSMTGQEKDDFRSFRHVMGDTLKDCCYVLGSRSCLLTAYDMITSVLSRATSPSAEPVTWQEIEAPLFSMRSMGAEIDPTDDEVIPKIMDLIPSLPTHPRVRYAATLVIARYTEWLDRHPDYVQFQLTYVSAGFNDADTEVSAAAGQAIKYMCKDCKQVSQRCIYVFVSFPDADELMNTFEIASGTISTPIAHVRNNSRASAGAGR
jgi:transportin-3